MPVFVQERSVCHVVADSVCACVHGMWNMADGIGKK